VNDYDAVPKELALCKQWSYSHSKEELKRPKHSHYTTDGSMSMSEAWDKKEDNFLLGFYTTVNDGYILGDVDHIENPEDLSTLPLGLADLLQNHGAYSEVSPSGKGIRFVLKLEDAADKAKLRGNTFYTNDEMVGSREAQINIGPPWMTITGNTTSYSSGTIGVVTLEVLETAFKLRKRDEVTVRDVTPGRAPSLKDVFTALHTITLDQNPRIRRAYKNIFQEEYSHYTFWLKVLMALHDYATYINKEVSCLEEAIKWSETDAESYTGEQAVIDKWESFEGSRDRVSYRTLFGLAYANVIRWPKVKALTKKQKANGFRKPMPLNTEYVNFLALVDFYQITVYKDIHSPVKFYVTADEDIAEQYFTFFGSQKYLDIYHGVFSEKTLTSAFHILSQDKGFVSLSQTQVAQFVRNLIYQVSRELDVIREYFNTPFTELPERIQENATYHPISTVEYMFSALKIDYMTTNKDREYDLYYTYYKSWLMGMVRNVFFKGSHHMNNCVLLLTGAEQIRKTSHFRFMLPQFMREEYIAFTTHGFASEGSMRDIVKLSSENLLIAWDEIEQYLTRDSESNFKKIIDNTPQKFIDKYEVIASVVTPMAMYGATSNKREFNLSDTGSRRIYHIPVAWVDTDKLNKVCWHRIVNDLRDEITAAPSDNPPWLLTETQLGYQTMLHQRITNKTGMVFILSEMFRWDMQNCIRLGTLPKGQTNPRTSTYCKTFGMIKKMVAPEIGHIPNQTEQIALKRSLARMCSVYTKTDRKNVMLKTPRVQVNKGSFKYNGSEYFIVPHQRGDD